MVWGCPVSNASIADKLRWNGDLRHKSEAGKASYWHKYVNVA